MIVRFFKTGLSNGESPVNYLLREADHQGNDRGAKPEILEGNPDFTIRLINECGRVHKYASGVLAFRPEEQPTRQELFAILDRFRETFAPGISPEHYHCLFVRHEEARDRSTGLRPFHVHFVIPMTFLGGESPTGKPLAGKRFNPHPPGQQSIETMKLFTAITNHEHGWKQVVEKPMRLGVNSFWRKVDGQNNARKLAHLKEALTQGIRSGEIGNRDALIQFLENDLGCTVTRRSDKYLSVKFPGAAKAIRLKGRMFEAQTDYAREFPTHSPQTRTMSQLTVPEYETAQQRLSQLLKARKPMLLGVRPKQPSTRTRKEHHNGQIKANRTPAFPRRTRRALGSAGKPIGKAAGLHGSQYPGSLRKRSGSEESHPQHPARYAGGSETTRDMERTRGAKGVPGAIPGRVHSADAKPQKQDKLRLGGSGTGIRRLDLRGLTAAEIDEEIRKLGIALDTASEEAVVEIKDQINALAGRREHLPRPK